MAVAVETLRGERHGRLRTVSLALAAGILELTGRARDEALEEATSILDDGRALERFAQLVAAQGGDPAVAERPRQVLPAAPEVVDWTPSPGVVQGFSCRRLGELAGTLGAGRQRQGDAIDPAVGLEVLVRTGDAVGDGPAVRVHARSPEDARRVLDELPEVVQVGPERVAAREVLLARVGLDPSPMA